MAAYEVLLLNTAIPQIQAAQSGDTYVVPRDIAINATAIISANSATDALRITQTGAGNAILVEDSANPDSTPFVVTAAGDVGIGTNSPSRKLDIALTPAAQVTGATIRSVGGTTNIGDETSIDFQVFSSTYYNGRISGYVESITGNGKGGLKFYTSSAGTSINATPSVTLDSSGNLGLGVTPSAWGGAVATGNIQLAASSLYTFGTSGGGVVTNAFYNSSNQWVYRNSTLAALYQQSSGTHAWFTAASGTAGNAISFTQAMTLDASGNLLVGTTSTSGLITGQLQLGTTSSATAGIQILNSTTGVGGIYFGDSTTGNARFRGMVEYNHTADALFLSTAETERARITSGGYFKASSTGGYESGTGNFHEFRASANDTQTTTFSHTAASPYGIVVRYTGAAPNNTDNWFWYCDDNSSTQRASLKSNGGLYNYQANDSNLSDRREKTNFAPAGPYLSKICAIPVQTFNYIDQNMEEDPGTTLGVVAQDVQAIAPELVMESNWGTEENPKMRLSIYQTDLQYALMKCIQEQQAMIDELKAEVAALKGA